MGQRKLVIAKSTARRFLQPRTTCLRTNRVYIISEVDWIQSDELRKPMKPVTKISDLDTGKVSNRKSMEFQASNFKKIHMTGPESRVKDR